MQQNQLPFAAAGAEDEFERVEVRRSARRKKTISAEIVGSSLVISIPERMSRAEEQEWVARMTSRMSERRKKERLNSEDALVRRAKQLSDMYLGGVSPDDIAWIETQRSRWGWCDPQARTIRISLALAEYPPWVRDYVIVHELAHLLVADHSNEFWDLVNRYPLTERARGYLMAKGVEEG